MRSFLQVVAVIILLAVIGVGISLWQPWKAASRTIQTTGEGKVMGVPDVAKISASVQAKDPSQEKAQATATESVAKLIAAAKALGIAEKDIQTESVSTYPNYSYATGTTSTNGFISRATISIVVRDLTKAQQVLDMVTKNGGTSVSGPNLTFSEETLADLSNKARQKAITDAKEKATNLAKSSGTKIKKVMNITEGKISGGTILKPYDSSSALSVGAIATGEDEVSVSLSVTYSIR